MPKPKKGETQKEFIDRCMGDDEMLKEFPDEKQRLAVCHSKWDEKKSSGDFERRSYQITELRVDQEEGKKPVIKGYAAVFNKLSEDLGGFREKISPGAFKNTIVKDDIRALFNHDPNYVLGRTSNDTLRLKEDEKGLAIEIDPPETQWARDLMISINRKDIDQMSFGFQTLKDEWDNSKPKDVIRTLIETILRDISPVTFPAYPQTSVKVRDHLNALSAELEDRDALFEKGSPDRLVRKRILDTTEKLI